MNDDDGMRTTGRAAHLKAAWRWFRAFRRTRPFWGAAWLIIGGYWVLHYSLASFRLVVSSGFSGMSGWLVGGGMMLCGVIGMLAPSQRYTVGIIGTLLAIASLVTSNLGGFLVGMACGILGGTMLLAWGPKAPKVSKKHSAGRTHRRRRASAHAESAA